MTSFQRPLGACLHFVQVLARQHFSRGTPEFATDAIGAQQATGHILATARGKTAHTAMAQGHMDFAATLPSLRTFHHCSLTTPGTATFGCAGTKLPGLSAP